MDLLLILFFWQKEFDFIVQGFEQKRFFRKPVYETKVVFEIDGGKQLSLFE